MNFGDILDEWDKETAKPYGKKRLKDDRERAAAESCAKDSAPRAKPAAGSPGSPTSAAQSKASRKSAEPSVSSKYDERRANPMDIWLRRYGTEDKDAAETGAPRAKHAADSSRLSTSAGQSKSSRKFDEPSVSSKSSEPCGSSKHAEPSLSSKYDERRANPMDVWLRRHGTEDKDAALDSEADSVSPGERRRRLRAMRSEAVLDLHGMTRDEAWFRLETFFADCVRRGLQKVLIIHGKGTHSEDDPVLAPLVKLFIEQNRHAGESGHSAKEEGGSGSTWVILK